MVPRLLGDALKVFTTHIWGFSEALLSPWYFFNGKAISLFRKNHVFIHEKLGGRKHKEMREWRENGSQSWKEREKID